MSIREIPQSLMIGVVRIYQRFMSPLIGPRCRFTPTCSEYYVLALRKHGLWKGSAMGLRRLLKCHPWNPGGHDLP